MPKNNEESTLRADGNDIPTETAGPFREEEEPEVNREALGDGAATAPLREGTLGEKEAKDTFGVNPKRTVNSRPS